MQATKLHRLVGVALFAAIGYVLMNFAFPIIPLFPFLKFDFSDLTVLLGGFIYGPVGGIMIAFIRSLAHFALTGGGIVNLIGDSAAFFASVGFMLPIVWWTKPNSGWQKQLLGLSLGIISLTVIMSLLNWLIITPMYLAVFNFRLGMSLTRYVLIGVVPFNLAKGIIISVVFYVVQKALAPWLAKRQAMI